MGQNNHFRALKSYGVKTSKLQQAKIIDKLVDYSFRQWRAAEGFDKTVDALEALLNVEKVNKGLCAGLTAVWLRAMMNLNRRDRRDPLRTALGGAFSQRNTQNANFVDAVGERVYFARKSIVDLQLVFNNIAHHNESIEMCLNVILGYFQTYFRFKNAESLIWNDLRVSDSAASGYIKQWRNEAALASSGTEEKVPEFGADQDYFVDAIVTVLREFKVHQQTGLLARRHRGVFFVYRIVGLEGIDFHAVGFYFPPNQSDYMTFFDSNVGAYQTFAPWTVGNNRRFFYQFFQVYGRIAADVLGGELNPYYAIGVTS